MLAAKGAARPWRSGSMAPRRRPGHRAASLYVRLFPFLTARMIRLLSSAEIPSQRVRPPIPAPLRPPLRPSLTAAGSFLLLAMGGILPRK